MPVECVKQGTHFRSQFTVQNLGWLSSQRYVCGGASSPDSFPETGMVTQKLQTGAQRGAARPLCSTGHPPNPSWAPRHQLHGPPSRPPRAARLPGRVADTARPGEWPKTRPSIGSPWLRVLLRVQRLPCFSSSLTDGQQLSGKCLKKISIMKDSNRNWNKRNLRNRLILGLEESPGGERNSLCEEIL